MSFPEMGMGSSGFGEGSGTQCFLDRINLSCLVHLPVEMGTGSGCRYELGSQLIVSTQLRKEAFFSDLEIR